MGIKFCEFHILEKNYTQKTKIYMVNTLFLTDSQKSNPTKYTTYTVIQETDCIIIANDYVHIFCTHGNERHNFHECGIHVHSLSEDRE